VCTLTARVTGLLPATVTFAVSPRLPGDNFAIVSGPDGTGLTTARYTAPNPVLARQTLTVTATAVDGTRATQLITVIPPTATVQVTPSATVTLTAGQQQSFTANVLGVSQTSVTWTFSPQAGSIIINGNTVQYTAPNPITATQTITFTATSTFDPTVSGVGRVQLNAASITVTPTGTIPLAGSQRQQFTATVNNLPSAAVTWSISPQIGSVDSTGLYTAPNQVATAQTITVTATSVFDPRVTGVGRVQLNVPSVAISPTTVTLGNSQQQQFTATVNNLANTAVTWSIAPVVGTIDQTGLYTAPGFLSATQRITVTATSVAEPARTASASVNLTPVSTVGSGAPTEAMVSTFQAAWNRNGFNALVALPPVAPVRVFGNSGYVQEFLDVENTALRHALVTGAASVGGTAAVFQILAPLWTYYSSVNPNTAGYPLGDSQICAAQGVGCVWGLFDRSFALFAYQETLPSGLGPNFTVNGVFFTEWTALGAMNTLGSAVSAQNATIVGSIVPPATVGTPATVQTFARGAIYSITNGPNRGKIFGVAGAFYELYLLQSGPAGSLGLPTSEAYQITPTTYRQNFEGGVLQHGGGDPTVLLPISAVTLSGALIGSTITLNVGQTLTLQATPMTTAGEAAPDRPVSWSSTNGKVVSIQATGGSAVVTAIGAGSASVQAASQGISSGKVSFIVISPCCRVGDGAPASVQQAFQDALLRNRIAVQTPLPSPAERVGGGYVQLAQSADGRSTYLLTHSDRLGSAYVVSGPLLGRYEELGGPAGMLGYPAGDASAGGTQVFANGAALGGAPVRLVSGPILTKWGLLGFETGAAGFPVADATAFSTFGANSGLRQSFSKGAIYAATAGPRSGQVYFVSGAILARYEAVGGAAGDFGMPASDEFGANGGRQQNFEGGRIVQAPGDAAAVEQAAPRVPAVIASPVTVFAGGRARVAVYGFPNGSALRISVSGSPDFTVTAVSGAYTWEMAIPLGARSGPIGIRAIDSRGASADGSFTVKGFADNRIPITKLQGDGQTGLPGAMLPLPLRVALIDTTNVPVAGAPLTFGASSGVGLSAMSAVTDANGRAEVFVRLPARTGAAGVTVSAPAMGNTVTFNLVAAADSLSNFPRLAQAGDAPLGNGTASIAQKGALLTSVASILRHHQNRGELRNPNGLADPAALNDFLKQFCTVDSLGAQLCDGFLSAGAGSEQVVNLWRAAEFTGGVDVAVRGATGAGIADALAEGSPVLLSLALTRNAAPAGGHFVVATGVAEDGAILIYDPNPALARPNLNDYLRGFTAGGVAWSGELRSAIQLAPRNPPATRFLIGAMSGPAEAIRSLAMDVQSVSGSCGTTVELLDAVDGSGNPSGGLVTRLRVCDGIDPVYQLAVGAAAPYRVFVTDLATAGGTVELSGAAPATYKVTRNRLNLILTPQDTGFSADAVVNAATFGPGIAPGGIMSIFGTGLAGEGATTTVEVEGVAARVLSASAFQINAVVPLGTAAGIRSVQVRSGYGLARQSVEVSEVAPAIFLLGSPTVGAVVNQDGTLNGPAAPLARGQTLVIYATGLGAVAPRGGFQVAVEAVVVVLNGVELPVTYAGLTAGYPGLYQVNVAIPVANPPGLGLSLALKQGGRMSNTVPVAVQ
jgi:uncharacterized protein (TIGR03437 family)